MEWNKIKSENENKTNESRHFLESNFVRVNRLLVFGYPNQDNSLKMLKPEGIIFQKVLLRTIKLSSTEKTFMINQLILI